ncbi:riboflavin synthase subunit alpha [Sulfurifustis variabilis]|uniref:Riboflavin synthase n=1 Tax=Sulfurifustis variabilis TaxID=1675686 RepID=A0A1B4V541_9GAMM|nr:riboflavin synthase [Sulfurifustis variabilis]BAU48659.1 riboflavin synthase subunit alpha [Sulfurifustis variabilis]
MFTGIIQAIGSVRALEPRGGDAHLRIQSGALDLADVREGDSIAVNGVCLTAIAVGPEGFAADASAETLGRTTLGRLKAGDRVNLEKALALGDRLGGHLVSGHVDGVGRVRARERAARSERFTIEAPPGLARYIAEKGSICVDGVSLTVNAVDENRFTVNIVPHTLGATTLGDLGEGAAVNLEVDLLARYLERLLHRSEADPSGPGISLGLLARAGFLK